MAALITANTCPACRQVHGPRATWGQPADWPTCPEHGHWLYVLRGPLAQKDVGWTYACQARYPRPCTYTHTQKEKATMTTTNEAATAALAIRQGQDTWDQKQLAALRQMGVEDAPQGDLDVFFHYCQATGLDPFAKQIRLRKDRQKNKDGQYENRWSIETEIDGYRVIAHRAAKRDGVTLSYGPTLWYDRAGGEHKIWLGDEPPAGASLTVYKDGAPFPAVIRLKSFAKYTSQGQLQAMWAVMPDHLIAKCAEAQALRKAFPHDLEGIRLSDEPEPGPTQGHANGAPAPAHQISAPATAAGGKPKPPQRSRTPDSAPALRTAIGKQFDRLGVEDPDERKNYVYKLANKDPDDDQLTDHDLRFALSALAPDECPDLAALVELCAPEPATP